MNFKSGDLVMYVGKTSRKHLGKIYILNNKIGKVLNNWTVLGDFSFSPMEKNLIQVPNLAKLLWGVE